MSTIIPPVSTAFLPGYIFQDNGNNENDIKRTSMWLHYRRNELMPPYAEHYAGTLLRILFAAVILVFFPLSSPSAADSTSRMCRVSFPTVPEDAVFYFNGLEKKPDSDGEVFIEPGPALIEIKRGSAMAYSAIFVLDSAEKKVIPFDCTENCALLHVTTDPDGATISMNGVILGTSPYLNGFIPSGSCSFMVTYPGRIPVIRRVELSTDSVQYFSFKMEYTQALKDSITAVRRALKQKRQLISGLSFGGTALIMIAAGAYYDHKAYQYLIKADHASGNYDMAASDAACDDARDNYKAFRGKAKRPILYRNLLYGTAGAAVLGFYLSFIF
jgi:hypothetical protein